MDKIITVSACGMEKRQVLAIGRQMENNYRQIVFDCSGFDVEVASVTLVHLRSQDIAPYIVETSSTDTLTWTVTNTDTAYAGYGKAELRISFTNGLAKSVVFTTMVIQSITADTTIPQPLQSWYDAMIDYIDDHSVSPEQIEEAVAEYLDEHPVQAPVQSVNGKQGTVVLTASDIGALPDSTQIPTKTSQLQNDSGFLTSAPVESVNGETGDVVITAADLGALTVELDPVFGASAAAGIVSSDITAWNGKYTKPSSGIPATDLTGTVQSRLLKTGGTTGQVLAKKSNSNYDTEWVNQSGGGGAVDSVNGQTGTVVLDASDVGALPDSTTIDDVYWCTYGTTTSAQIETALTAGKLPMVKYQDYVYTLRFRNSATNHRFICNYGGKEKSVVCQSGTWMPNGDLTFLTSAVTSFNGNTGAVTYTAPVTSVNGQTGAVTVTDTNTTYTISISGNVITLTPSTGTAQSITLPVYSGGVI